MPSTRLPFGPKMLRGGSMFCAIPRVMRHAMVPSRPQIISGITRDASGVPMAGVTVKLFRTADNVLREVVTSDATGNYTFSAINDGAAYYVVAYKAGAPDVAGTSTNVLVGS